MNIQIIGDLLGLFAQVNTQCSDIIAKHDASNENTKQLVMTRLQALRYMQLCLASVIMKHVSDDIPDKENILKVLQGYVDWCLDNGIATKQEEKKNVE